MKSHIQKMLIVSSLILMVGTGQAAIPEDRAAIMKLLKKSPQEWRIATDTSPLIATFNKLKAAKAIDEQFELLIIKFVEVQIILGNDFIINTKTLAGINVNSLRNFVNGRVNLIEAANVTKVLKALLDTYNSLSKKNVKFYNDFLTQYGIHVKSITADITNYVALAGPLLDNNGNPVTLP